MPPLFASLWTKAWKAQYRKKWARILCSEPREIDETGQKAVTREIEEGILNLDLGEYGNQAIS